MYLLSEYIYHQVVRSWQHRIKSTNEFLFIGVGLSTQGWPWRSCAHGLPITGINKVNVSCEIKSIKQKKTALSLSFGKFLIRGFQVYLGMDHYFFYRGVTIFGTCRQFFLKSNVFQTIFFITFCNENNFFTTIFKKHHRLFYRSYLKKKNTSCACIHMKVSSE